VPEGVALPTAIGLAVGVGFVLTVFLFMNSFHARMEGQSGDAVIIKLPEGASESGATFEPQVVRVILGVNNTVVWINEDRVSTWIEADNDNDPVFFKETSNPSLLSRGDAIQYTFTKVGEYGFHGKPHQRGTVVVLPSYCQIAYLCS
jgi:plastocyanin